MPVPTSALLRRGFFSGTRPGCEDETGPGFSRLVCIHFMVNGKTKHFIFLLFLGPRKMVFLLASQGSRSNKLLCIIVVLHANG